MVKTCDDWHGQHEKLFIESSGVCRDSKWSILSGSKLA